MVEERLFGDDLCSPSVQLRISPMGDVEVLSTHDQLLGGPSGQMFLGCTFPAEESYRQLITRHARAVGSELARRGVVGRFGVDFITRRTARGGWEAHAIEVNLRNGGTTHPALILLAMTDGQYDDDSGKFVAGGKAKHYVASDHLEHPAYRALTPDDALDVLSEPDLAWNPERLVGAVSHMTSAVAVSGRVGITAVGDSAAEAQALHESAQTALEDAAEMPGPNCAARLLGTSAGDGSVAAQNRPGRCCCG
ncbi:MAG: ATP-grasp domain-containing protein [Acidimicrobiia bacterium]